MSGHPGGLPPLFSPVRPGDPVEGLRRVSTRLDAFRRARALGSVEAHVAAQLGRRVGVLDPDVLLALALAVRAPRHGHVCVDLGRLEVEALLPPGTEEPGERLELSLPGDRGGWIASVGQATALVRGRDEARPTPFVLDGSWLYTDRHWRDQQRLAHRVRQWATAPLIEPFDADLLARGLTALFPPDGAGDRPRLAAALTALSPFTVITGGPGMGKTFTVRNVLVLLLAQHAARSLSVGGLPDLRIALAAPTGKAAARLRESIRADLDEALVRAEGALPGALPADDLRTALLGLEARTLHRLLGYRPDGDGIGATWRHDRRRPLPFDLVVVDEASMVDLAMMARLTDAVGPGTRVVLLGDRDQLSSVEAGTVLADLCGPPSPAAAAPRLSAPLCAALAAVDRGRDLGEPAGDRGLSDHVVQLVRTWRFHDDSGIGRFARACAERRIDDAVAVFADGAPDARLVSPGDAGIRVRGELSAEVVDAVVDGLAPWGRLVADDGWQARFSSAAAYHRAVLDAFDRFRVLCAHRRGVAGVEAYNERVTALVARRFGLRPSGAWWPGRPVLVVRNDYALGLYNGDVGVALPDERGELVVAFRSDDAPGVRTLAPSRVPEHETVFAMTIHKSQGSEFDHAMVVLPSRPSPLVTRELVYTGVTRARRQVTLVGSAPSLRSALSRAVQRASGLTGELW